MASRQAELGERCLSDRIGAERERQRGAQPDRDREQCRRVGVQRDHHVVGLDTAVRQAEARGAAGLDGEHRGVLVQARAGVACGATEPGRPAPPDRRCPRAPCRRRTATRHRHARASGASRTRAGAPAPSSLRPGGRTRCARAPRWPPARRDSAPRAPSDRPPCPRARCHRCDRWRRTRAARLPAA